MNCLLNNSWVKRGPGLVLLLSLCLKEWTHAERKIPPNPLPCTFELFAFLLIYYIILSSTIHTRFSFFFFCSISTVSYNSFHPSPTSPVRRNSFTLSWFLTFPISSSGRLQSSFL